MEPIKYIGIDCGLNGAIVEIVARNIVCKTQMPTISNGKRREIDIKTLVAMFEGWSLKACSVIIEDPGGHAPSAAGLRSMTYSFAIIKALTVRESLPHHTIGARKWQAAYWSKPAGKYDTKAAALKAASQIWPWETWTRNDQCRKAFDGYVDAALIAEWGRRNNL
jgi:hypothetical protein